MRKINWDEKLSDEDVAWLRQAGSVRTEDQIAAHQARFEDEVPEDTVTQSALDPNARANTPADTGDGPTLIDPTQADPQDGDGEGDDYDYDDWKVSELDAEVTARNSLDNRKSDVEVVGTGANGKVTKPDLIKGLRLWDSENVGVL
jgi:hypothetical protein